MKRAFVLGQTAVLVFDWFEPDPDGPEQGVRVEVRLVRDAGHRGTESAAQEVVIDGPLWRADLFDLVAEEPGNFLRAHYHPFFDGVEPSDRYWDAALTADPLGWLAEQLSDLQAIVGHSASAASVDADALSAEADDLRIIVGEVVAAARRVLDQVRASPSA
jgi:hypothetical protein